MSEIQLIILTQTKMRVGYLWDNLNEKEQLKEQLRTALDFIQAMRGA